MADGATSNTTKSAPSIADTVDWLRAFARSPKTTLPEAEMLFHAAMLLEHPIQEDVSA